MQGEPLFWLTKIEDIAAQLEHIYQKAVEEFEKLSPPVAHLAPNELYINQEYFLRKINDSQVVEVSSQLLQNYDLSLDFEITPQHALSKSIERLLEEWIENYQKGIKTFFLSDNENQHKRMEKIMSDLLVDYNRKNASNYDVKELFVPLSLNLYLSPRER